MRYLIIILLATLGCKSTSKNGQTPTGESTPNVFQEVSREMTNSGIYVKLKNTSEIPQSILNPMKQSIERNVDGEWKKVGVLYCDCGGPPCPAPPNEQSVEPSGTFIFSWDLMVEECKSDQNGRSTVKDRATKGEYRAIYQFRAEVGGDRKEVVVNFSVD
ncbi:MAG: hypothetical protein ABJG47_15155 [Ekhidna sp.]